MPSKPAMVPASSPSTFQSHGPSRRGSSNRSVRRPSKPPREMDSMPSKPAMVPASSPSTFQSHGPSRRGSSNRSVRRPSKPPREMDSMPSKPAMDAKIRPDVQPIDANGMPAEEGFDCAQCSKSFGTRILLKQHKISHSKNRPYSCN
eukprot:838433_1